MKKISLVILIGLLLPLGLWAADIDEQQAQQIAAQFIIHQGNTSRAAAEDGQELYLSYKTEGNEVYVFNRKNSKGFVIVAGDDRVTATVLAYSNESSFDYEHAPDAAKMMLRSYADGIEHIRKMGESPAPSATAVRRAGSVSPLLTTSWHQHAPYNDLCPDKCLTGCVATAIAQIMNYWEWPKQGSGKHTNSRSTYGETRDFSQSTYDWEHMSDTYVEGEYTDEEATAVARLMSDIGTAVNMSYGTNASSAYSVDAYRSLFRFFDYSEEDIHIYGGDYQCEPMPNDKEEILRQELDAGRPVYYSGADGPAFNATGHAMVIDGYDTQGYFHINYGWGYSGGYYQMGSVWMTYIYSEQIITGIQPRKCQRVVKDGVFYDLVGENEAIVASSNGTPDYEGDVTIPASVSVDGKDYVVSGMHRSAISSAVCPSLKSISILANIKELPDYMLYESSQLKSVTIGDGVETIGRKAFAKCDQLEEVTLGSGVTEIKDEAFQRCFNLTDFKMGKNVRKIGSYAFELCKGLTSISLGDKMETIGNNAFVDCLKLTGISFPATIKFVGDRAFCGCPDLTYASFSEDARDFVIDASAFYQSSNVWVSGLEHAAEIRAGAIGSKEMKGSFTVQPTCKYARGAIGANFDEIILPAKLTSFDVYSVTGTKAYVVEKGNPYFYAHNGVLYNRDMTTLQSYPSNGDISVTVPVGVEAIGDGAFHHTVYYLTLPGSVKTLDNSIPLDCREVTCLSKTPPAITNMSVTDLPVNGVTGEPWYNGVLKVPYGCKSAYEQAEIWKRFKTITEDAVVINGKYCYELKESEGEATLLCRNAEVAYDGIVDDIPASITVGGKSYKVTYVDQNAFRGDMKLKHITFGGNIYSMGESSSYDNCPNLESVTIGKTVEYFGQNYLYATFFQNCPKLAEITVEAGNPKFFSEDGVLYYKIFESEPYYMAVSPAMRKENGASVPRTTVVVSDRIQKISNHVFTRNLRNVVIPASITFIDGDAFEECTQLKTVTCLAKDPADITLYSSDVFNGIKEILPGFKYRYSAVLQVPTGSKSLYENAYVWQDFETIVEIDPAHFNPEAGDDGSFDPGDVEVETVTALVILTKDGSTQTFELAEQPVVTIAGTNLKVVSNTADVTIPLNEIVRYTFFKRNATNIEEVGSVKESVDYQDGVLTMDGLTAGSVVNVYAMDGRLVQSATVTQDGTYRHSLSSLARGVYIVKVNNLSYKILKR